jgi:hypothetical protein
VNVTYTQPVNITVAAGAYQVVITEPANNANVQSPVHVHGTYSGIASYMKLWVDHVAGTVQQDPHIFDTDASMANGPHLLELQAVDSISNKVYTDAVNITVAGTVVVVTPPSANVAENDTQQFTANVQVTWSVTGDGTIDSNGLFLAGSIPGSATVTATATDHSGATGNADVTVGPLTVTPATATTQEGHTQQFTANATVTWTATCGTIDSTGLFTAPMKTGDCEITATDQVNATANAIDTVIPDQPNNGNYTTWKNDNMGTGQQLNELTLTPANVNANKFGVKFSVATDGVTFAQPLYMSNVMIGNKKHNVVFVATEHDSVYAFDADTSMAPLWFTTFLINGAKTVAQADVGATIYPEIGITSTPVIDPLAGRIYVVAATVENGVYIHRLHALDVTTGREVSGSPVVVSAKGFQSKIELQRSGLLLVNGNVYFAFASYGDHGAYHGWVFAYNASTLAQVASWNNTPGGAAGGIWMSGQSLAADQSGNVYLSVGNGSFNGTTQFGMSFVKLNPTLNVIDYFTPWNEASLNKSDGDLGSGGVLLVPDQNGAYPHEMIGCGKYKAIYLVNRDEMGHINVGSNSQIIQEVDGAVGGTVGTQAGDHCFTTAAFWNQNLYFTGNNDVLKEFSLDPATGKMSTTPSSQSVTSFSFPGGQPVTSSNGSTNGIVWAVDRGNKKLHAFDATDVSKELYTGPAMTFAKWTVPTVINGKVFVATQKKLYVYGLF